jgi:hypothetical protein
MSSCNTINSFLSTKKIQIGSGENYQTQEISVLHRKLMEIRGSPNGEDGNGRLMSRDFVDWEKLGAELPQIFATPPGPPCTPSGNNEEVGNKNAFYFLR